MSYKQGTNYVMDVGFEGLDMDDVERIEFLFRTSPRAESREIMRTEYPGGAALSQDGDAILVPWTEEDTYRVPAGSLFYMDTKIYLKSTTSNPQTPIVELRMDGTLFRREVKA